MGVLIRKAKEKEADELTSIALKSKAFWGYPQDFIEACKAELKVTAAKIVDNEYRYFLAELEGEIIGFYALELISADRIELEALFVEPASIGKGIGRLLMEHARKEARQMNAAELVIQGDPHADKFYLATGAERIGEKESASIPGRMLPLYLIRLGENR